MTVGEAIARVIGDRSQKAVAETLGVAPSTVNRWISGEYTPGYEELARIEDVCGEPRGTILRAAGYVTLPGTVTFEEFIARDLRLSDQGRSMLLALWENATKHGTGAAD